MVDIFGLTCMPLFAASHIALSLIHFISKHVLIYALLYERT